MVGTAGYVWTFTNMEEVAFMYRPTREGEFLKELLKDFEGVLVSDFYGAYDSLDCNVPRRSSLWSGTGIVIVP